MRGGLEHLKLKTKLINERLVSVMGECDLDVTGAPSIFKIIRSVAAVGTILPHFDFCWERNPRVFLSKPKKVLGGVFICSRRKKGEGGGSKMSR